MEKTDVVEVKGDGADRMVGDAARHHLSNNLRASGETGLAVDQKG